MRNAIRLLCEIRADLSEVLCVCVKSQKRFKQVNFLPSSINTLLSCELRAILGLFAKFMAKQSFLKLDLSIEWG